ncbi:hypothetical protein H6G11_15685 [Cyanobacterium aponinum FACHB-4101]|uniref:hypothetical protein n=1 Tax=Cyanobacterium aponinum TaxID=379064 RepID=UPI00168160C3|nr:hypothetical protein [Cyanobacterium aponinum]MBD2395686.1 hypothetical protein [Cyanobacterium aponinum FACHB-4101]
MIPSILPSNKHLLYFYDPECECDLIFINIYQSPNRFFLLCEKNYDSSLEWCADYAEKLYNTLLNYSQLVLQHYEYDYDPFLSQNYFNSLDENNKKNNLSFWLGVTREERIQKFKEEIVFTTRKQEGITLNQKMVTESFPRETVLDFDSLWEIKRPNIEELELTWNENSPPVTLTFLQGMYRPYIYYPITNLMRQTFQVEKLINQNKEKGDKKYTLKIKDRKTINYEQKLWGSDITMGSIVVNCEDPVVKNAIENQIPEELLYKNIDAVFANNYGIDPILRSVPYLEFFSQEIKYYPYTLPKEGFLIKAFPIKEGLRNFRESSNLEENNPIYMPCYLYRLVNYSPEICLTITGDYQEYYVGFQELNWSPNLPAMKVSRSELLSGGGGMHYWINAGLSFFYSINLGQINSQLLQQAQIQSGYAYAISYGYSSSDFMNNVTVLYPTNDFIDYYYEYSGNEFVGLYGIWHELANFQDTNYVQNAQNYDVSEMKTNFNSTFPNTQDLLNSAKTREERAEIEGANFQSFFDWMKGNYDIANPDTPSPKMTQEMEAFFLSEIKYWLEPIPENIAIQFDIPISPLFPPVAYQMLINGYTFQRYNHNVNDIVGKLNSNLLPFIGLGLDDTIQEQYIGIWLIMTTLVELIYEQQEKIDKINACLGASEFAYQDDGSTPAYMHIARKVDYIAKALGICFDLSGEILSVRQSKHLNRGDTIPAGWYLGQFGRNTGANTDPNAQKGGLADEERLGIVYEVKGNRFETNQASGDEEITQGGYILCESIPQLIHIMLQDLDRSLGLQTLGSIAIANPNYNPDYSGNSEDIKTPYWKYNGLGQIILDLMYLASDTNRHAAQANIGSLKAQAVAGEVLAALGTPAQEKAVPLRVDDEVKTVRYPAFNSGGMTIADLLFWALQNLAIQNEGT